MIMASLSIHGHCERPLKDSSGNVVGVVLMDS